MSRRLSRFWKFIDWFWGRRRPDPPVRPDPPTGPAPGDPDSGKYSDDAVKAKIEHNDHRRKKGLGPLILHDGLVKEAEAWAQECVRRGVMTHDGWQVRVAAAGFPWHAHIYGTWEHGWENLASARGSRLTGDGVTRMWVDSPGHAQNVFDRLHTHFGFGMARSGDFVVAVGLYGHAKES